MTPLEGREGAGGAEGGARKGFQCAVRRCTPPAPRPTSRAETGTSEQLCRQLFGEREELDPLQAGVGRKGPLPKRTSDYNYRRLYLLLLLNLAFGLNPRLR